MVGLAEAVKQAVRVGAGVTYPWADGTRAPPCRAATT
jgi:hypothetical protein